MLHRFIVTVTAFLILAPTLVFGAEPLPFSRLDPAQYNPAIDPDIDMFIGDWRDSMPRVIHGSLVVRDILTELTGGDPLRPDRKGACLTELKTIGYASLEPGATTVYKPMQGFQELYYIDSGSGTLTSGGKKYDLRFGIGIVAPPGVNYSLTATGSTPLKMYRVVEPIPSGFTPKKEVTVKNEFDNPQGISVHWCNIDRGVIGKNDGTAVMGFTAVKIDPMTMAQPHSHNEGVEEIWISVRGATRILLGKQLRDLPPGSAYKIPATGITAHANINISDSQSKLIHMMKNIPGEVHPYSMLAPAKLDPAKDPDVDLFMGDWRESMPRVENGSLVIRDILTPVTGDDPLKPERKGACLTLLKSVSYCSLESGASTFPGSFSGEQALYYVTAGKGVITSAGKSRDIEKGSAFLIPPGIEFTMSSNGDGHLMIYRVIEPVPAGFTPKKEIVVTSEFAEQERMYVHWSNIDRVVLGAKHGTATITGFTSVKLAPMSIAQPHSHAPGEEEVWIALEGDITVLIGKQLRKLPVGSAYKVPENGITAHANINPTGDFVKLMHMMKDRSR